MRQSVIWATALVLLSAITAVVIVTLSGKSDTTLLAVLAAVVSPWISALVVRQDVKRVESKVDNVDTKVNGHLSELTSKIPSGTKE